MRKICFLVLVWFGSLLSISAQENLKETTSIITIGGEHFYVYTVRSGDTFYGLAREFETTEEAVRQSNPHLIEGLQVGQTIKIPVVRTPEKPLSERRMSRLFDTHTVNQGETAYSISKRYGISLHTLIEDNPGFDPAQLSIGQQINIRIKSQGKADDQQLEEEIHSYTENLNSVSAGFLHHAVGQGETLYSLSRRYSVPVDTIARYNQTELRDGLKMGTIIRIPSAETARPVGPDPTGPESSGQPGLSGQRNEEFTGPFGSTGTGTAGQEPISGIQQSQHAIGEPHTTIPNYGYGQENGYIIRPGEVDFFEEYRNFRFKDIDQTGTLRVVFLLPLKVNGTTNRQFAEFYEGALLALGELKSMGVSAQVDLFNTARSSEEITDILNTEPLQRADLIIGPVYEEIFAPVARFAAERGIPIVSPLATVDTVDNPAIFQVAPSSARKYDKLRSELSEDKNIILITGSTVDTELRDEVMPLLPSARHEITYSKGMAPQIERSLSKDKENIFVILPSSESTVDDILARISSVQNNRVSRSMTTAPIKIIGSSRWARFQNIDRNLYFKLNLIYVTSYHADRGNQRVVNLDSHFVTEYGNLPSHYGYAYRGYDVTKLFVGTIKLHGNRFAAFLNQRELPLLQTPYQFTQSHPNGKYINSAWSKVSYNTNYTIDVE